MENRISIRNTIGDELVKLAQKNKKIIVVNADMVSTCRLAKFEKQFPNRIFNVGIAEQNMVSFAAGLAHEGYIPFIFSMAPFMSMRACEQIRTDIAYENLDVKIISPYSGFSGGISGPTHWGMEDYAILSSFPNITIFELSDNVQAKKILKESLKIKGPVYIRCGAGMYENIYDDNETFNTGKSKKILSGKDGLFICSGSIVNNAIKASKVIKQKYNKNVGVIDMYCLKPLDESIMTFVNKAKNIVIAQDHNKNCGIGNKICTFISKNKIKANVSIIGIPDKFIPMAHPDYLYRKYKLDSEGLVKEMVNLLK